MSASLRHTAIRFPAEDLAEIDRRARARGLTRTRYIVACALGKDPHASPSVENLIENLDALTVRVGLLERRAAGVSGHLALLGFEDEEAA